MKGKDSCDIWRHAETTGKNLDQKILSPQPPPEGRSHSLTVVFYTRHRLWASSGWL